MHAKAVALSLAAAVVVRADLRINNNDIPQDCSAICRPIRDLGNICTVNFNIGQGNNNSDQTQDELDAQCVCTNSSFDLKNLAPQCNACMIEKVPQDQQRSLEGIQSIMNVCQLPSASGYASSSTSVANTVIVLATRLTASSQLTTTFGGSPQTTESSSSRTRSSERSTITTTFLTSGNGGLPSIATSTIVGGGRQTGNAAPGLVAPGSNGLLGAVGAIVAGAFALGAFML
ncbi:CAP22 protein [Colletotrichum tofieldiae]|uniref:CAP22 protein n=2 Tax=Colletotrichum spaethianum species complex TaxID=2707349 RepID=A0A166XRH3_9PEZI|nr:CAP22 protein [Colletotrichum tofieldiae]GJC83795.1 protein CAP22 [Colletotrichum liriopes]GKT56224.1 CAP22 protein [Colletotrichum tofieldiae]GKT76804.1 CAP22 protein [Colletotrichum tofieldiae]